MPLEYALAIIGLLSGVGIAFLTLWMLRRMRPEWFVDSKRKDNAVTITMGAIGLAIISIFFSGSILTVWTLYGMSAVFIGIGMTVAVKDRKKPKVKE